MNPTGDFWDKAGVALVLFALAMGMGSCSFLVDAGNSLLVSAKAKATVEAMSARVIDEVTR